MKNGKEIFEMIYDGQISDEDCLEVIYEGNTEHYLLKNSNGYFDDYDLITDLLFKEYSFKVVNQAEIESKIAEKQKQDRISQLETELARLRGE